MKKLIIAVIAATMACGAFAGSSTDPLSSREGLSNWSKNTYGLDVAIVGATDSNDSGISFTDNDPVIGVVVDYQWATGAKAGQYYLPRDIFIGAKLTSAGGDSNVDAYSSVYLGFRDNFATDVTLPFWVKLGWNKAIDIKKSDSVFIDAGIEKRWNDTKLGLKASGERFTDDKLNSNVGQWYRQGVYVETRVDFPFGEFSKDWRVGAEVAANQSDAVNWADGKIWVGRKWHNGWNVELAGVGTDKSNKFGDVADKRFIATVGFEF